MRKRPRILLGVAVAAVMGLVFAAPAFGRTYEVTITDLTNGQPLTPPVVATHTGKHAIFDVGETASVGVQQIAENGNNGPLLAQLGNDPFNQISHFEQAGMDPLVPAGRQEATMLDDQVTFTIEGSDKAKRLSFEAMLICTNDGFTGVDSLKLPSAVGKTMTKTTAGYDAGTEINTEDYADIVPPCQSLIGHMSTEGDTGTGMSNPALAEGGVIHHHLGILGVDDLVRSIHGWTDPVARIEVERTD